MVTIWAGKQSKHGHLFFGRSWFYMVTIFKLQNIWRFYVFINDTSGNQGKHGHLFFSRVFGGDILNGYDM